MEKTAVVDKASECVEEVHGSPVPTELRHTSKEAINSDGRSAPMASLSDMDGMMREKGKKEVKWQGEQKILLEKRGIVIGIAFFFDIHFSCLLCECAFLKNPFSCVQIFLYIQLFINIYVEMSDLVQSARVNDETEIESSMHETCGEKSRNDESAPSSEDGVNSGVTLENGKDEMMGETKKKEILWKELMRTIRFRSQSMCVSYLKLAMEIVCVSVCACLCIYLYIYVI